MAYPIDVLVNDFVRRSFRETADKDYIHARLAYRAGLTPQFLWSALHCLEKYCKAILVLNRIPAIEIGHEITPALTKLGRTGKFSIETSDEVQKFVNRLDEYGAKYRYYETSYWTHGFELKLLDQSVWEIRRYCQVLDHDIQTKDGAVNLLQLNLARIRRDLANKEKGCSMEPGGWLESVLADRTHPARPPLVWQNLYFGASNRRRLLVGHRMEAGNSPLNLHPEVLEEAAKYVKLPKIVVEAYRDLRRRREAGEDV